MHVPHSATRDVGRVAVLIPLRSLSSGKARLAKVLSLDERLVLIEWMANRVIAAAHDLDVLVVHDDPLVNEWAVARGAATLQPDEPGLNHAISAGRDYLRSIGYDQMIVAHGDLPHAQDLRSMLTGHEISIAPDRHRSGTNVMSLPTGLDFAFAYGSNSFDKHVAHARGMGIEPHIVEISGLAWDVDHPDDLQYDQK